MKVSRSILLALAAVVVFSSCNKISPDVKLSSNIDTVNYSLGLYYGLALKQAGVFEDSMDINLFASGLKDAFENDSTRFTQEEAIKFVSTFVQGKQEQISKKNLEEGKKFLDENKKRTGVITTASGLQYEVITEGTGPIPVESDVVVANYHGTTIDGTVFDSSVERGQPATFPVNGVIPGWQEVLKLMKTGSKYKVYIPSELAYGPMAPSEKIKPNSTLIFEIELLEIKAPEAAAKK